MAVDLSDRYISDRYMPDKAIDLIDEAAAKVRISRLTLPPEIKKKELDIEKIISEKEESIKNQDFEKAANLRDNEKQLKEEFEKIKNEWRAHSCTEVQIVDEDDIAKVVSIWTKVPVEKLTEKESVKLLHLEDTLRQRVVGQDEAIKALTRAVKRARVGLKNPNRPIGTFIFCGPTGVGKTELCNVLAEVMFGKISNLIRIDMSEYMEKHSVSRLIGAPPGYVGYEEGGQLSEAVRRKPYSVVLLDEIEKAHPDVFNILLQIMEDGRLTDGKGKTVDFKNTIVIMTSNVGAQKLKSQRKVGFDTNSNLKEAEYEKMKDVVLGELKNAFKPEFLNRVDDIIVFNQLKEEDTLQIVNIMLKDTINRLKEKNIDYNIFYKKIDKLMNFSLLSFLLACIICIIVFGILLKKKVQAPLNKLNGAMHLLSEGKNNEPLSYSGPKEFVDICNSFNVMVNKLESSELERNKLIKDKHSMLADISHDLKTPITTIQGYAKALADGVISEEEYKKYFNIIYSKSKKLTELINIFYEYSKLEHPDFKLVFETVDLSEYLRAYVASKYEEILDNGFNIEVDIPEKLLEFKLDKVQFQRVLDNILGNSMKHNPPGTEIYVELKEVNNNYKIIIADNGTGIPKEIRDNIFSAFIVGDESRNTKQGSGLGLAITKTVVEMHGGSIKLKSSSDSKYVTVFEINLIK